MKTKYKVLIVLLGMILLLSTLLWLAINQNQVNKQIIARLEQNQTTLLTKDEVNSVIQLTLKEFEKEYENIVSHKLDSVLESKGIKKKQIQDVTNVYNTYNNYDTVVIHPEPVITGGDILYPFRDSTDCFVLAGVMQVIGGEPVLDFTERSYTDTTTITGYWKKPHKFWFLEWGRKQNYVTSSSNCGKVKVQKIDIIKKKD